MWFLCTKIREKVCGVKIRELAHRSDSVVLHNSRREELPLLTPVSCVHYSSSDKDGEAVSPTYGVLCLVDGGSETLKVDADLNKFIPLPEFKGWKVMFEMWPHDILLRTNMATSMWQDMPAMVAFRDASVLDKDGAGIPAAEFLRMVLQLQSLPESSTYLCGKPALRKS